jgi:phage tail-like protein
MTSPARLQRDQLAKERLRTSLEWTAAPFHVFNFHVDFVEQKLGETAGGAVAVCSGAFAECTGLEVTMEPKVIKAGGHNYTPFQRVGPVTFATVILKRGMTRTRDLWKWFELATARGAYKYRLDVIIRMRDQQKNDVVSWKLSQAMPVKFKAADLNARGTEVGIEELHLVHEGLTLLDGTEASV